MERIRLSDLKKVNRESKIPGNFTSVRGEYYIPQIGKTAFYKLNNCIIRERQNEDDLREMLCSRILGKVGIPRADILLATDDRNGTNGCLSINILNEYEHFVELDEDKVFEALHKRKRKENAIDDFIDRDLTAIKTIPGITSEDLRKRKEYLLKHIFISALIQNTDIRTDNMLMVRNKNTGELSNPAYYDMGLAFTENNERYFFKSHLSNLNHSDGIIEYLYQKYPSQTVPLGRQVQENLNKQDVNKIMQEEEFKQGFPDKSWDEIERNLFHKVELIERLNAKEQNRFRFGIGELHDASKNVKLPIKAKIAKFLSRTKENVLRRTK